MEAVDRPEPSDEEQDDPAPPWEFENGRWVTDHYYGNENWYDSDKEIEIELPLEDEWVCVVSPHP